MKSLEQFLEDLSFLDDRESKTEYLLEVAERFVEVQAEIAQRPFDQSHRVPACESDAYVWASGTKESAFFHFAVENPQGVSAKAIATILAEALNGLPASEAMKIDESLVHSVFGRELSMGKGEGLMGIVRMVRALAEKL